MKIIKHGTPKERFFECPECGCVFVAFLKEKLPFAHLANDGLVCKCPDCGDWANEIVGYKEPQEPDNKDEVDNPGIVIEDDL